MVIALTMTAAIFSTFLFLSILFPDVLLRLHLYPFFWGKTSKRKKERDLETEMEMMEKIPGPPTLPFVGNLFDVAVPRDQVVKGLLKRRTDYGTIYRIWMGPIPIVHISKPKYIEVILGTSRHTRKGNFYKFLYPWLGTGLLTSSGQKWYNHRKLITPTFHFKILEGFLEVFAENSLVLVKKLREKTKVEEKMDIFPLVTLCALDIICETAMGIRINAQSNEKSPYVSSLNRISELTTERSNKLWLHPDFIFYKTKKGKEYKHHLKILHNFTRTVIKERKVMRKKQIETENVRGKRERKAFLDLLLEASDKNEYRNLSENDIREEVDTFMFEGHDTTTAGICWTLFLIGLNLDIQEKIWEEQRQVFGNDKRKGPSMEELGKMKVLERVIKESLRLYPSVSFISRRLDEKVTMGKYTIPADTTIAIDIINVHRNPSIYPDPEKFDPDRWLPAHSQDRHPYAYIPFSAGPRNCIGQRFAVFEEKVILSYLLRNFKFEAIQSPKKLTLTNELILRPLEGILLKVTKRFDPVSVFLTSILFLILWKILFKNKNVELINKLPGPRAYPLAGNVLELLEPRNKALDNLIKRRKEFGSIFRLWLGSNPAVIFSDPYHIEILLKSSKHSQKAFSYKFLHPWLGTGLLTSHGKKWNIHRKLITPTFHFKVLQEFIDVFYENASVLLEKLKKKAQDNQPFDIFPFITLCALDIICETAMGTKIHAQSESQNEYVKSVYSLSTLIMNRINRAWLHPDFIYEKTKSGKLFKRHLKVVQGFTEEVIKARREALKAEKQTSTGFVSKEKRKLTFLDLLLESLSEDSSVQLTDVELREEVDTFMFEGHDTTAAGISWTLYTLGHHPEIQEEVYKELNRIFEKEPMRNPTMSDLAEMKLLERVIKESLRLYPSVSGIGRIIEEDVQFDNYLVPKGTNAVISIYSLHRDPKIYPDPEKFDPDRFLPENCLGRHPFAYLPFSAGPRNCIGQKFALLEEKTVLSTLLRNFKIQSMDKQEEKKKLPELILRPEAGINVKISRR